MESDFKKNLADIILASFILSIFYYVPFLGSLFWIHLLLNGLFILFSSYIFLKNSEFFLKKNGVFLFIILIFSILYSLLIFNIQFVFLLSIIFAMSYSFLGYYIGFGNLKFSKFSRISSIILFFGLSWVVLAKFIDGFNYVYSIDYSVATFDLNLYNNGYNIGRTGWNTSLIILYFLFLYLFSSVENKFDKLICFLNILLILTSVIVSDGKTGILIILSFFILNLLKKINYIKSSIFLVVTSLIMYLNFDSIKYFLIENSRLGMIFDKSSDFTTGRGDAGLTAIEIIKENLLMGTAYKGGYTLFDYGYDYKDIHNVWLNIIANFGIIFFIFYFSCLTIFVFNAFKISWKDRKDFFAFYQLIIASFIVTFVEPWVFVSYLPYVAIFWFTLGMMSKSGK